MTSTLRTQVVHNEIQLRHILKIREEVFIQEQEIPYALEIDEHDRLDDPVCIHFLLIVDGMPAGCARAIDNKNGSIKIQRIAISKNCRKKGYGSFLLKSVEDHYQSNYYKLSAQEYAIPFYERNGYQVANEETYLDADIPHKDMEKKISK